jgi:hypothetical protein
MGCGLGDQLKIHHENQIDLETQLAKDPSKTPEAKKVYFADAAMKRVGQLNMLVLQRRQKLNGDMYQMEKRLANMGKIQGTTDVVILNSIATSLGDASIKEILQLTREGDIDVIRAVKLAPALRIQKRFREAAEVIAPAFEQAMLGEERYAQYLYLWSQIG